jgi:hypothetical protein
MKNLILQKQLFPEIKIPYDPIQKRYYRDGDPRCIYPEWKKKYGIHKAGGNFPAMVARHHYEKKGYLVEDDYCLIRKPRQREKNVGYQLICKAFGKDKVSLIIKEAETVLKAKGMGHGGDPDLFVYQSDLAEAFFVETKEYPDRLRNNQKIVMNLIKKFLCPVYIAEIISG